MTKQDFYDKFGLKFKGDILAEYSFLSALDKLYLEFTLDQALAIVMYYYENADDIYNDAQEAATKYVQETTAKLKKMFQEAEEKEEEKLLDKLPKA